MAKKEKTQEEKAATQAANIMKQLQGKGNVLESRTTVGNYEEKLKATALYCNKELNISLKEMTPNQAQKYLEIRAEDLKQKSLDMYRQAIQCMMQNVTNKLEKTDPNNKTQNKADTTLKVVKSEVKTIENARAYTNEQVAAIAEKQNPKNALATEIAYAAGLRAQELHTLAKSSEQQAHIRDSSKYAENKFTMRDGNHQIYTVNGKGGLIREVAIPNHLSEKLEKLRLDSPVKIQDRHAILTKYYDLAGGKKWSDSFAKAASRVLGWSTGAHGLRHSYAQERVAELSNNKNLTSEMVLKIVSEELGHFRADITLVYLR